MQGQSGGVNTFPAKDLLHKRGFQCLDQLVNDKNEFYDLRQMNHSTAVWGAWLVHSVQQIKLWICHFIRGRSSEPAQSNDENRYFGEELTVMVLIPSVFCFQALTVWIFFRSTVLSFFDSLSQNPLTVGTAWAQRIVMWKVNPEKIQAGNKWSEWENFLLLAEYKIHWCVSSAMETRTWLLSTEVLLWWGQRCLHRMGQCHKMQYGFPWSWEMITVWWS